MKRSGRRGGKSPHLTAELFFFDLSKGFAINAQRGCRAGLKSTYTDLDTTSFTEAIIAVVDQVEGLFNFLDQLALTISSAQLS